MLLKNLEEEFESRWECGMKNISKREVSMKKKNSSQKSSWNIQEEEFFIEQAKDDEKKGKGEKGEREKKNWQSKIVWFMNLSLFFWHFSLYYLLCSFLSFPDFSLLFLSLLFLLFWIRDLFKFLTFEVVLFSLWYYYTFAFSLLLFCTLFGYLLACREVLSGGFEDSTNM